MTEVNNVDHAVTPKLGADTWGDDDELTEDTGTASELTWGRPADSHFAAAHAVAAALRKLRPQRPERLEEEREPPTYRDRVVNLCELCHRHYVAWHSCSPSPLAEHCSGSYQRLSAEQAGLSGESLEIYLGSDYYEGLGFLAKIAHKLTPTDVPEEWRAPPGYSNYIMHSVTRELWRQAYTITLPNGGIRSYSARLQKPRNGSYSLTVNGVTSSRGVNALWAETFAEFGRVKNRTGEWSREVKPHRSEFSYYRGLQEWLAEGGAGIVTRPK